MGYSAEMELPVMTVKSEVIERVKLKQVGEIIRQETIKALHKYDDPQKMAQDLLEKKLLAAEDGFSNEEEKLAHDAMVEACIAILDETTQTKDG